MRASLLACAFTVSSLFMPSVSYSQSEPTSLQSVADHVQNLEAADQWQALTERARGQNVYFNAWGGEPKINSYIQWVSREMKQRYGVNVKHVKLADTAAAVTRVEAEKSSGRDADGAIDLIWINGENFARMKQGDLLFGPFAEGLPNWQYVDVEGKPATVMDFTIPTEGYEAPWSMAQIVFYYDSARLQNPPKSMQALYEFLQGNPGGFTFPQPPDFIGSTFLKQALLDLADTPSIFQHDATGFSEIEKLRLTQPLWAYMDQITPLLWQEGRSYPRNTAEMRQLINDGETLIGLSFNPAGPASAIGNFELPETTRTYILDKGTISNANYLAIPYNSQSKEAAQLLVNFLLSPEAQIQKQDPDIWGSFTILDTNILPDADQQAFNALPRGAATLSPAELTPALNEPHASWMTYLENEWNKRYGDRSLNK